ncbi:MAG: acyl-CoA thioesterase [Crocinitomicaceae bacterium]|nr:acyl-CoA thioesterase [Crocinitomicaceae bacterium]
MIKPAQIQVRFADLDTMGHVNNTVYLSYFEYARVHYFNELLGLNWDWKKFGVLVARNEINYHLPVLLNDTPQVEILLDSIGAKSFTLAYEIKVNGKITTTGKSVLVCFDASSHQSIPVSEEWKQALSQLKPLSV